MMKRLIPILVIVSLLLMALLQGCAQPTPTQTPTPLPTTDPTADYLSTYYKTYSPAITLTQNVAGPEDQTVFFPGDNWKSNQYTDWAKDKLGIIWEPKWTAADGATNQQKLTLAMASDDLPDVIATDQATMKLMVDAGQVIPLNELWEKHASPMVKEVISETDSVMKGMYFSALTFDNKMYGIPSPADVFGGTVMWYRTDLITELGKSKPTTVEEFENLMAAYKAAHPDGIALGVNKDLLYMDPIFAAFGAYKGIWLDDGTDKLAYSGISPKMKDALAALNKWYGLKYIDQEFIVKDFAKENELMAAGNMLAMTAGWWATWAPFPTTLTNVATAQAEVGPYLKGPNNTMGSVEPSPVGTAGWCISAKCKNPEAVFYQYNLQLDSCYRNDTALRAKYPFVYAPEESKVALNVDEVNTKGPTYEKHDYTNPGPGNGSSYFWNRGNNGVQYGFGYGQRPGELANMLISVRDMVKNGTTGDNVQTKAWFDQSKSWFGGFDQLKIAAGDATKYILDSNKAGLSKMNQFLGAPTQTMVEKSAYLTKLEMETYLKIITGELPISAFDDFVTQWKSGGGDAITTEVNAWFAGVKG